LVLETALWEKFRQKREKIMVLLDMGKKMRMKMRQ